MLMNALVILVYLVGFFVTFSLKNAQPKQKAKMAVVMGICTLLYLVALALCTVGGILQGNWSALILAIFMAIPFTLGRVAKYSSVKLYSVVQIIAFVFSLAFLYLIQFA